MSATICHSITQTCLSVKYAFPGNIYFVTVNYFRYDHELYAEYPLYDIKVNLIYLN